MEQAGSPSAATPAASSVSDGGRGAGDEAKVDAIGASGVTEGLEMAGGGEREVVAVAMESDSVVVAGAGAGAKSEDDEENILDLTSFQLHDLKEVDLPPTLAELDLTSNRLTAIDPRIANLSYLQVLRYPFCNWARVLM